MIDDDKDDDKDDQRVLTLAFATKAACSGLLLACRLPLAFRSCLSLASPLDIP